MAGDEDEMTVEQKLRVEYPIAVHRRNEFLSSIPENLMRREDSIASQLANENASINSKLRKVYMLAEEFMQLAAPHVACDRGCSDCCKMNVMISESEAVRIGQVIGQQPLPLPASKSHDLTEYAGVPCPFLNKNSCSIYQDRPLVCRTHFSFAESAYWCGPDQMNVHSMPIIEFHGLRLAVNEISSKKRGGLYADIRDFFGSFQCGTS